MNANCFQQVEKRIKEFFKSIEFIAPQFLIGFSWFGVLMGWFFNNLFS
jgi:hypothetical protein